MKEKDLMKDIVALCKRRGIIYPSSEIYGGFANTWDYGPYGVLLKNNVKQAWWKSMVQERSDIVGLDSAILMNPKIWEASGHLTQFSDNMIDCPKCKSRYRFPEDFPRVIATKTENGYQHSSKEGDMDCAKCGTDLWKITYRPFNLMFQTFIGPTAHKEYQSPEIEVDGDGFGGIQTYEGTPGRHLIEYDPDAVAYLRPETAQGIFVNFKNVLDSTRVKLPFGIAQIGKAFRNEITPGNFTFRTLEFEQFELEYFIQPKDADQAFEQWRKNRLDWYIELGINSNKLKLTDHPKTDLAHYAKAVSDVEYEFPFGWSELEGIANRTDYDLKQHQEASGEKLDYTDENGEKILPYVIEPSGGVDRAVLAFLVDAYAEEQVSPSIRGASRSAAPASAGQAGQQVSETRTVLRLHPKLAPIKVAILPLVKKDAELVKIAKSIFEELKSEYFVEYDEDGTVGKRYRRQDEIGTPFCITVDSDSLTNKTVTIRHRDSMVQDRVEIAGIKQFLQVKLQ